MDDATVEAVARAIAFQLGRDFDKLSDTYRDNDHYKRDYLNAAHAALAALPQEPTQTGMPRPTREEIARAILESSQCAEGCTTPCRSCEDVALGNADAILALFGATSHE